VICDSIFNILVVGCDTTAATLTFAVYMLAEHPTITACLRAEVLAVVGPARMLTYNDVQGMKFLRVFINGALVRFTLPPNSKSVCFLLSLSISPSRTKPSDVLFNTNCFYNRVRYNIFLMHRRTDLWGPDALEFDPDRFLDERLRKYLTPNPFIFLPFNAGRSCASFPFAYNEASFFLIRLLQRFSHFELVQDEMEWLPASWKDVGVLGSSRTVKFTVLVHAISR
ncbi:cytochrome P450, partial [Mycena olivaceomarginata]